MDDPSSSREGSKAYAIKPLSEAIVVVGYFESEDMETMESPEMDSMEFLCR